MKFVFSKRLRIAIEIVILGLLALLFLHVLNFRRLQEYISLINLEVIFGVLLFQLAIQFLHAVQWELILHEAGIARGLWRTFWARISGFAITYLTPSVTFAGEPVRATLYKDSSMRYGIVYATVALDKYIELFTKLPCIAVGFSFLIFLAHPGRALIVVAGCILLGFFGFFIFLAAKLLGGGQFIVRLFRRLLSPLERFKPDILAKIIQALTEFSTSLHEIIRRRRTFYFAMLTGIAIAVIEVLQTYYILGVLDNPNLTQSFVIYATVLIQHAIAFLPGNLGGMEATHLFIFNVLGIGSTRSFVYTIILRLGQLTMVLLGFMYVLIRRIERVRPGNSHRLHIDL